MFTIDRSDAGDALSGVLSGTGENTACVADVLSQETTRIVTHVVLGVRSADADAAVDSARAEC